MSTPDPLVSVVIPTCGVRDTLPATLHALADQSYPRDLVEVIVVDDGSAGATAARNAGAARARGSLLVFLDDDIELLPGALAAIVAAHRRFPHTIVVGELVAPPPSNAFERLGVIRKPRAPLGEVVEIDFTECHSGLLSAAAEELDRCGGFQDPTGGWPNWDDIDLGYRARGLGIGLLRCSSARAVHHDRSSVALDVLCRRWYDASVSAVRLFQVHPGIESAFPMYRDKLPVRWGRDPWRLVARKLLRSTVSRPPAAWLVRRAAGGIARRGRPAVLARPLCGLALSGAMWRGLRAGIARHGPFA